jgi:nicotinamidase-related amidase
MNEFLTESELNDRMAVWIQRFGISTESEIRLRHPALCVLDMQNDFLRPYGAMPVWGGPVLIPRLTALLKAFRAAKRPIFYSRHICLDPGHVTEMGVASQIHNGDNLLREGCKGSEIVDDLRPDPGEHVITKYRYSAFYASPLELLLRSHGVQDVVVTGVVTNVCCETTAHDAFFRNFGVVFVVDGTGGFDEQSHLATLKTIQQSYGQVATVQQLCRALNKKGANHE